MRAAVGEYILFCDSDDYVSPFWCEIMLNCAEKYPKSLVICDILKITDSKQRSFSEKFFKCSEYSYFEIYKKGLSAYACNKIYRRDIITANSLRFDEKVYFGEDVAFNLSYFAFVISACLSTKNYMHTFRTVTVLCIDTIVIILNCIYLYFGAVFL